MQELRLDHETASSASDARDAGDRHGVASLSGALVQRGRDRALQLAAATESLQLAGPAQLQPSESLAAPPATPSAGMQEERWFQTGRLPGMAWLMIWCTIFAGTFIIGVSI